MRRLKQEKGSATLFVLLAMLFFIIYLVGMYMNSANSEASQLEEMRVIKETYEEGINNVDDVYATLLQNVTNLTQEERDALLKNGIEEITGDEITNENLKDNEQIKAVITGNVPIPSGFSYVEGTKETGVVVRNNLDSNEFVWIPTDIVAYDRYAFSRDGWGATQTLGELDEETNSYKIIRADLPDYYYTEAMPSDEQTSVNKYKGYYIGRYEAGIASETARSSGDASLTAAEIETASGKPLSQLEKHTYNYVTRDQAKGLAEGLYTKATNNVISKLCSSYAWDTALQFIDTQNEGWSTNSTGNYNTESGGTGILQKTGYDATNTCNIYDMGGNVYEWTTEDCINNISYPCVIRRRSLCKWNSRVSSSVS